MHFSAFQHTLLERWESRVLVISLFWFPPSQVPYKVSASQDTEREKWKKCIIYLSFFTAPPPLPSGQKYCSTNLTDQPSTTPPLSVWISGLNTEFRKGTITAAQCRSPTPCSNSPSYSVPVVVPVSVLRIPDFHTVDFVLFRPLASCCGHEFFFFNLDIWMITDKKLWKIDLSIKFYIWQNFLLFTSTAITVL